MSFKKFIAPNLIAVVLLSIVWLAGIDQVYVENDHQINLTKYVQTHNRIVDNYVGETDINELHKNSMLAFVRAFTEEEEAETEEMEVADLEGTPLDTIFTDLDLSSVRESVNRFEEAYLYIANKFPEKDMGMLTESALRGMFTGLDPHSVYIEPEDSERMQEDFEGRFQGIGIQFSIMQDTITVVTPISGGPSDQLGIISGDRIIEINDSSAIGLTNDDVVHLLRGPAGTEVDVTIYRPGLSNRLNFTIVRDDIPITTIDASYMLDDRTGYIKINRFAATTHDEFLSATADLTDEGMERLVVDFRNNPGGYLSQAIAIAEEFFPRGTRLVSTESRHARFEQQVVSRRDGLFKDLPVIMLVNEGSASASEIVSGAVQDHDRGLIVGRRTFGKGLVQQQYELVDNSNIRVTISRYLTPSGRLIQKPYENGREAYVYEIYNRDTGRADVEQFIDHVPDSLRFTTTGGREVYGGGGIVPDFIVPIDTTISNELFNFIISNGALSSFALEFMDRQGSDFRADWESDFNRFQSEYRWPDDQLERFTASLNSLGMVFVEDLESPVHEEDGLTITRSQYEDALWLIEGRLKAELARRVWGMEYYYPIINEFNDILSRAMELWDEVDQLAAFSAQAGINLDPQ
ncbi:MAG: S41 family peptidase [Balneolaceae bacterium]